MNRSGQPVRSLLGYYKLTPERLVVIHDDLDLPFGTVKLKNGGGHGGHNGLRDVNKAAGNGYARVRIGVGRPPEGWSVSDYVLGKWNPSEAKTIASVADRAANAVESVVRDGLEPSMNHFNQRHVDASVC